ncbi:hypothetical protein HUN01_16370 [Nostoc edaphicum CCNP1411]|uniref:Uncharacterized protein n=1 Tax=Nostoc edaphicum CCNP1411 TaxID=1472755 RepID=A0A7D7LBS4_9NOSO|nr:hypothetical protein [Nostoc edaphicum]QMS89078.1 hypothetical protein HUN01_16370 [Nostoc edaphicum CCNP1411]
MNQPISKIHAAQVQDRPAKGQINAPVVDPTLTAPAKFQGKMLDQVQPSNNEKVIAGLY